MNWFQRRAPDQKAAGRASGTIVEIATGSGPVPVELNHNLRARRYSLRQSASRQRIVLTIPRGGTVEAALEFARGQGGWLARQQRRSAPARPFREGCVIPYRGTEHVLRRRPGFRGAVRIAADEGEGHPALIVTAPEEHLARRLRDWLKAEAKAELAARVRHHADMIKAAPGRISVRDQASRWGSCSSEGNLNFSWRLILAPPAVLDYVAAHEVAHLIEMNHSRRFWKIVETLCPDMKTQRRWLKANSTALHAIGRDEPGG